MHRELKVEKKLKETKNWRPCRMPAEACFVYLQHSHSAVRNAYFWLEEQWSRQLQAMASTHDHTDYTEPYFSLIRASGAKCLKTISCGLAKKKKILWCSCFACCIFKHEMSQGVSSRWAAGTSSAGLSQTRDMFSITNCIRWKNMFS